MDYLLSCLIWEVSLERWPSLTVGTDEILSLYRVKAKGSVGWSSPNVSKGSCPRSTFIKDRQSQSHQNINLEQYRQPFYQPKPSQTPLTEFQKIQNFHFFWNRPSDCDPPRLNWQLHLLTELTKKVGYYMDWVLWAKRWYNKMSKMKSPNCRCTSNPIIISGQGKRVCWLVGGKCVNRKLSQINFDQH